MATSKRGGNKDGAPTGAKKPAATKKKTGTGTGSKKTAGTGAAGAKTTGATKRAKPSGRRAAGATAGPDLRKDLRGFVEAHPGGWGHNEWIGLVNHLRERGHDTSDTDAVGMALERERLRLVLERVPGLGPQRISALADKYPRIWNLMQANAEEIAAAANLPRAVARRVKETLG